MISLWCPDTATAAPTLAGLRAETLKRLTSPAIGSAPPPGHTTLVNFKTLFWITGPRQRPLGHADLLGLPIALRAHYRSATFDFGDTTTATLTDTLGTPYNPAWDCGTCEHEFGHTYTDPGPVTITAHTHWNAQFRIGTGAWTDIPGELTPTRPARIHLRVKQAHAQLVAPP